MTPKIIFFDIDDTLCRLGKLPDNNLRVLQRLHEEKPCKLAIATGRSLAMLPADIRRLLDLGYFDSLISANGQYNMLGSEVISHYPLNQADAAALVAICRRFGLAYQQLSAHHVAWSAPVAHFENAQKTFSGCVLDPDYYLRHSIYQFSIFLPEQEEQPEIVAAFEDLGFHLARWHKGGADILPAQGSKARGIADICQALDIQPSETMAFGDGLNDMEMLQAVGIGIAMGNAWEALKAAADYVTGSVEESGIEAALTHFGILSDA